jgi:alpha-galactosidase
MGAAPYNFRSGFNAGISFCEDTRPESYPREVLRAAIAEGKRIRKYYFGNLYALTDITTSPKDWCVAQYHRPAERDGMVVAFRRHLSAYTGLVCALSEIDPDANYEVIVSRGYEPSPGKTMKGAELSRIEFEIDEAPGSMLFEYRILEE